MYIEQTWNNGDVITSAKMNHIEDGIANAQSTADGAASSVNALSANGAIGTQNLANGAVTDAKLASNAVTTAKVADGAVTMPKLGADVIEELDTKADIDGSYESMTVGNAEQLISSVGIEDSTPYNFRTSGGSTEIGDREELNAVVGGTVAWNQNVNDSNFDYSNKWSARYATVSVSGNIATMTPSSNGTERGIYESETKPSVFANHVYLLMIDCKPSVACGLNLTLSGGSTSALHLPISMTANTWNTCATLWKTANVGSYTTKLYALIKNSLTTSDSAQFRNANTFDLTQMFGSTIADYIYALEQSNAGAGVAYFRKLFPKPYYAYNSGELLSVKTNLHRMVGFNAYNPTTGTAKVVSGNQYQITGAYTALSLDGTTITPDANGKFTPSANGTLTVTGGNSTTTCVHLVWDGERNGEYEPYVAHEYALDDITLRGILKLDANNNLYADGDRYLPDGTVERRYVEIDLGAQAWTAQSLSNNRVAYVTSYASWDDAPWIDKPTLTTPTPAVCVAFDHMVAQSASSWGTNVGVFTDTAATLPVKSFAIIKDSGIYADAAAFKAAMNNVKLVYKIATPTTETASPYQQTQIVDDFGTEEFVDAAVESGERDVAIPVGNETVYKPNLRAKLEMAPDSPDGDGDYIVRQTNGQNSYIPLVEVKELPDMPSSDGAYKLRCTVSNGTATLSWVSDS